MRFFILLCFLLLAKKVIFANASPYDESYFYKTGNIIAIPKKNIQVLDEKLFIKILDDDHCRVNIDYLFYNTSNSETINIALPVHYAGHNTKSVTDYSIEVNNQPINFLQKEVTGDSIIHEEVQPFGRGYFKQKVKTKQVHFLSNIDFQHREKTYVHIEYTVKNDFLDWESSKSLFPTFSLRKFKYDLSPARFWGNGTTQNIQIVIDVNQLKDTISIKNWKGFSLKNHIYTFEQKNFQYQENQVLSFQYLPQKLEKIYLEKQIPMHKIKSTSHDITTLFDRNFNTVWKGKVNVPLVIKLDTIKPHNFSIAMIINDVQSKHSNIKKMRLEVEYLTIKKDDQTHKISSEYWSNVDTLRHRDFTYPAFDKKHFSAFVSELYYDIPWIHREGIRKVSKITLTVLEVYNDKDYFVFPEIFITN